MLKHDRATLFYAPLGGMSSAMDDLQDLIEKLSPGLAKAFLTAISLLRDRINRKALIAALEARDVDAAIAALNIEPAAFNGYMATRRDHYVTAGETVADDLERDRAKAIRRFVRETGRPPPTPPTIPGSTVPGGGDLVFRFDMTNPRAEQIIRTQSADQVKGYVQEQIDTARKVIGDGFQSGTGPRQIAVDIAGRIDPISKRREGGIVGLSDPQSDALRNMRLRLASDDPDEIRKVFGMTLRDKRYDSTVRRALEAVKAGKRNPLSQAKIDEMAAKYSDRQLRKRAEDIARTETASGVEAARAESTRQAMAKANLSDDALTKRWIHAGAYDKNARVWHEDMNNVEVVGMDTPFYLPDGSVMLYPHDPAGGAKNNVACRCRGEHDIDWLKGLIDGL